VIHLEPSDDGSVSRVLDALLGDLQPGTAVAVKPDWNARTEPRPGESTTAPFLEAVLRWLEDHGAGPVALAHSSLLTPPDVPYTSFHDLLEIAGCVGLLEDFPHVRLLDLEIEPMELRGGFLTPIALRDYPVLINCVRLKTHMGSQIAVGCKGLMGLLPDSEHLRMHRDGLDTLLGELARALPPTVTLVEADVGMEGEGPHHGDAVDCGFVLGGDDLLELDSCAARLMGHDPAQVRHLAALAQGRPFPALPAEMQPFAKDFARPRGVLQPTRAGRVFPGDSCSTCHIAAQSLLDYAKANPHRVGSLARITKTLLVDGLDLYMGHQPPDRRPDDQRSGLALGDCSADFAQAHGLRHVAGCPMRKEQAQQALLDALGAS
jgi:uncharacterized protein (DUF362 family)